MFPSAATLIGYHSRLALSTTFFTFFCFFCRFYSALLPFVDNGIEYNILPSICQSLFLHFLHLRMCFSAYTSHHPAARARCLLRIRLAHCLRESIDVSQAMGRVSKIGYILLTACALKEQWVTSQYLPVTLFPVMIYAEGECCDILRHILIHLHHKDCVFAVPCRNVGL